MRFVGRKLFCLLKWEGACHSRSPGCHSHKAHQVSESFPVGTENNTLWSSKFQTPNPMIDFLFLFYHAGNNWKTETHNWPLGGFFYFFKLFEEELNSGKNLKTASASPDHPIANAEEKIILQLYQRWKQRINPEEKKNWQRGKLDRWQPWLLRQLDLSSKGRQEELCIWQLWTRLPPLYQVSDCCSDSASHFTFPSHWREGATELAYQTFS